MWRRVLFYDYFIFMIIFIWLSFQHFNSNVFIFPFHSTPLVFFYITSYLIPSYPLHLCFIVFYPFLLHHFPTTPQLSFLPLPILPILSLLFLPLYVFFSTLTLNYQKLAFLPLLLPHLLLLAEIR